MAKKTLFAVALILSGSVSALPEDRDQPIDIQADQAVMNETENRVRYEGAVEVQQGTFKLTGDVVDLTTNDNNEVETFLAEGAPARFENQRRLTDKEPVRGKANTIRYAFDTDLVVLSGDAEVRSEGSLFAGPEITYHLESGEVIASGNRAERVNMTMQPKTND